MQVCWPPAVTPGFEGKLPMPVGGPPGSVGPGSVGPGSVGNGNVGNGGNAGCGRDGGAGGIAGSCREATENRALNHFRLFINPAPTYDSVDSDHQETAFEVQPALATHS